MNSRGSEWGIWDLHFHTPSSYDYGDKSVTNEEIVSTLKQNNISVIAITDHHVIDVERIKILQSLSKPLGITVLPGIEFLSDARGRDPIHFIGIFPEDCKLDFIWAQIENKTAMSQIKGDGKKENEVYCDLIETIKLVKELGGIVSIHAGEKSGSIENITHSLPHSAAQKTDIAANVDIYELGKVDDQDGYRKHVFPSIGRTIPMIICSDNHNIKKYFIKEKLWIKGSPSFSGLKYALNEPTERFYIGQEPTARKRVKSNPTKYIRSIKIENTGNFDQNQIWFENIDIPLNSELVTIIGNKGNGKSALSDILAMCSDADNSDDYLFLHKTKFKRKGLADRFSASIQFETGVWSPLRQLDYSRLPGEQPKARYLPQSYFEKICNEISKIDALRSEIEQVVFQYISPEKRLGKSSFSELARHKQTLAISQIEQFKQSLSSINQKIILLEDKLTPDFKQNLLNKIKIKEDELNAHMTGKPAEKLDPTAMTEDPGIIARKTTLEKWISRRSDLESKISEIEREVKETSIQLSDLEMFRDELTSHHSQFSSFLSSKREYSEKIGVDLDKVLSINFNLTPVDLLIDSNKKQRQSLINNLIVDIYSDSTSYEDLPTLALKKDRCNKEIAKIQGQFNGEQREYQDYLEKIRDWEFHKKSIEGDELSADTLTFLRNELKQIETSFPSDLENIRQERLRISSDIFSKKIDIRSFYDEIKSEIDKAFTDSEIPGLAITSTLTKAPHFEDETLSYIQQNKSGSFYGSEGKSILSNEIVSQTDWNNFTEISAVLTRMIEYLENDKRQSSKENKTQISNLVKNRKDFYNFLFSLDYINVNYELKQNGKSLEQLSPGEKGALLLIFYLAIDKEDIPLIIDQPEDNLDNYSVAKMLVPFIKNAKRKRQIVIVTHNPNLAIVSDSEQIIKVDIEKNNGNKFKYLCGGIEDTHINEAVINVLEGTMPAFSTRKEKYQTV